MRKASVIVFGLAALVTAIALATVDEVVTRLTGQIDTASQPDKVRAFVKAVLLPYSTNATIVQAVETQNAKGLTLDEIKRIDAEWSNAEDELPIHVDLMGNACAEEIRKLAKKNPAIVEAFVMDNQGANVGQNELTSDYWQGDEEKWQEAYDNGKGGIHFGPVKLDKSSNAILQQIGLPIIDANGNVIGAVCYGLAADKL